MMSATELNLDYLANYARVYARQKAITDAGIIVAAVLYQSKASVQSLASVAEAERHVREWLAAY